jgi:hypothetical protein
MLQATERTQACSSVGEGAQDLQAISISNLCNFFDTRITQQAYDGFCFPKATNIRWPNQQKQKKGGWLSWCSFLGANSDGNRYILQPLGQCNAVSLLHHDHERYIATPRRTLIQK